MAKLNLYFHGGMCCAIKTIAGFPYYAAETGYKAQSSKTKSKRLNNDRNGHHVTSETPFFTGEAPRESTEDRLDRLIKWCKEERPQGCIEVALARSNYGDWDQNKLWGPLLEEHGFKVTVPEFLNSNSGNFVTIYHLVYDATKEKKAEKTATLANPFGRN